MNLERVCRGLVALAAFWRQHSAEYGPGSINGVAVGGDDLDYACRWIDETPREQSGIPRSRDERQWRAVAALILETGEPCEVCGTDTKRPDDFAPCPYAHDVNDDDTPVWLCSWCRKNRADDI